jgi:hypothetical protein
MKRAGPISRRVLLVSGLGLAAQHAASGSNPLLYRFATEQCHVRLSVEFHDRFAGRDRWLIRPRTEDRFCPSPNGEKKECPTAFAGSVAIVRYEVRSRGAGQKISKMRELVRTIDWDQRLEARPPFDRTVKLEGGVASDIQAFGLANHGDTYSMEDSPWYYFRQDLFLEASPRPFLILHWKHALPGIRLLDIIPTSGTSLVTG